MKIKKMLLAGILSVSLIAPTVLSAIEPTTTVNAAKKHKKVVKKHHKKAKKVNKKKVNKKKHKATPAVNTNSNDTNNDNSNTANNTSSNNSNTTNSADQFANDYNNYNEITEDHPEAFGNYRTSNPDPYATETTDNPNYNHDKYSDISASLNDIVSDMNNNNQYSTLDTVNAQMAAQSLYVAFRNRFSADENTKLSNMRDALTNSAIDVGSSDSQSTAQWDNLKVFFSEMANAIGTLQN